MSKLAADEAQLARLLAEIAGRASSALAALATTGKLDSIQVMHVRGIADQASFVANFFDTSLPGRKGP
jgi:hypothetical protein